MKEVRYYYCKNCGNEFSTSDFRNTRYCSDECREKGKQNKSYSPKERVEMKFICVYCKKEFTSNAKNSKYCSRECSKNYLESLRSMARYFIYERDKFRCIYCGKSSFSDYSELHIDHIVPKSKGGEDIAGNLVTACAECNITKQNRILSNQDEILAEVAKRNKLANIKSSKIVKLNPTK